MTDTFYDEQAPLREVREILRRVLAALQAMKESGCSVLLVCNDVNVLPPERNRLFATLRQAMDRTYRLQVDSADGRPRLFLEPPPQIRDACTSPTAKPHRGPFVSRKEIDRSVDLAGGLRDKEKLEYRGLRRA